MNLYGFFELSRTDSSPQMQVKILSELTKYPPSALTAEERLLRLRAINVSFCRQGRPSHELGALAVEKLLNEYPAEGEMVMGLEADEIALLAASLTQLAGNEREWLRTRLLELRDLLVLRRSQGPVSAAPARAARQARSTRRR